MRADLDGNNIEQLLPVVGPATNHPKRHYRQRDQSRDRRSRVRCDCAEDLHISSHIILDHTTTKLPTSNRTRARDITWFYFMDTSSGSGGMLWAMDINGCHCRAVFYHQNLPGKNG